ncbi:SDR family NAD(P)-dependent oxidoreductase [Pantoea rwandensis]|uniref:2-deoxy-D-gluconate 3-dehydrogenase n=1 Tax=Pantoea rwandensis TaxID=1076550 RepID=A0A1X1D4R0_9GAMM|nr:SDR family oxidoreductase [Pantoea rwandensis]ORM71560.1 2-deoxy-D-gluconate 3-dehydrogenase [Pantoea rwandensis]
MTFKADLFAGKTALVTGGTTGIGAGIASTLAELGANVIAAGVQSKTHQLPAAHHITVQELDVRDNNAILNVINALPQLDLLINCAGIISREKEHQVDVFENVIDINLTGTLRCCSAARKKLAQSKGCIVNTASMLSFFGGGLVPGYSASKGGIMQLTKSLAIAYAAEGIRVNAVAPGWIATTLTQALQDDPLRAEPILSRTPLKRWGTPADVAKAVVFLCSPAASFITGTILPVDGGYLTA